MAKCVYSGRSKPCDKVGAYCLTWQKQCTVEPRLMATSLLRPLFWLPGKNDHTFSCKETLVSTVTSLLQPNFFGPLVTILMGFHCMLEFNGPARAHFLTSVVNPSTLQPLQGLKRWLLYKASHCTEVKRGEDVSSGTKQSWHFAVWGEGVGWEGRAWQLKRDDYY